MAYLTPEEINSHLYGEIVAEIERHETNRPNLEKAITGAIGEAKSYLTQYDIAAIFGAEGDQRNPILLLYVKDIAVWHFITICNAGVELELREKRYKQAIDFLKNVQSGKANPELPLRQSPDPNAGKEFMAFGSNPKRKNHF